MTLLPASDLSEQVIHVLVALETATPELLDMASRSFRVEAVLTGGLYLAIVTVATVVGIWAFRWFRVEVKKESYHQREGLLVLTGILIVACVVLAIVLACQLPGQISQYTNARYYAVCDLLRRVHP